ncbi:hypothetical protein CMK12_05840 [Candidatus Poribacteria bacterium]|nr:hypothetical protein [Candidatus Poribacteria bacterium]
MKCCIYVIYVLLCLTIALSGYAYTFERVNLGDQYIDNWVVGGPFIPSTLDTDFFGISVEGGEKTVATTGNLGPGSEISSLDGSTVILKEYATKGNIVDFVDAVGSDESATAYAICAVNASALERIELGVGLDGSAAIWVNGIQVYRSTSPEKMAFDSVLVPDVTLKTGINVIMVKVARAVSSAQGRDQNMTLPWGFSLRILPAGKAVSIGGQVVDENRNTLAGAEVKLYHQGQVLGAVQTNLFGEFELVQYPALNGYDLSSTFNTLGVWQSNIDGDKKVTLRLENAISISGQLTMLDGKTPHISTVVEAVQQNKAVAKTLTNITGNYQLINLKAGQYQIRAGGKANKVYHGNGKVLTVRQGKTISRVDLQLAPTKKGTWRKYSNLDGLPHGTVHDILAAKNGTVWLATDEGVAMYDGKMFETYTTSEGLAGNRIFAICSAEKDIGLKSEGSGGKIWFATNGGISSFNGRNFKSYTAEDSGLPSNNVLSAYRDLKDDIWFGTDNGIIRYNTLLDRFEGKKQKSDRDWGIRALPDDMINDIAGDVHGNIWLATNGGVVRLHDRKIDLVVTMSDSLPDHRVNAIASDGSNGMWFGTEGGAAHFDGEKITSVLTKADGLFSSRIRSIFLDGEGNVWFGTDQDSGSNFNTHLEGGSSRYDGQNLTTFTAKDGLPSAPILAISGTADGLIWFGSAGNGIANLDEKGIVNFDTRDGLSGDYITAIDQAKDGSIWIGTWQNGATVYENGSFYPISASSGNIYSTITADQNGSVWFGGAFVGTSQFQRQPKAVKAEWQVSKRFGQSDLGTPVVLDSHQDSSGALWFGTWNGGVAHYKNGALKKIETNEGLPDLRVWALTQDNDGHMWFGTELGAVLYDGNRILKKIQVKDGLPSSWVNAIYCEPSPSNAVWFATGHFFNGSNSGLSRYNGSQMEVFTPSNTVGGLSSSAIRTIYSTNTGQIWFGTIGGGASVYNPKEKTWAQLSTKNGLAGDIVSAVFQDSDGVLWFGTDSGLTRYNSTQNRSTVRIVSVQTNNESSDGPTSRKIPEIVAGDQITITYSAINFRVPFEKRRYQYRLMGPGETEEWSTITSETAVSQKILKAGAYTFAVRFVDPELKFSPPTQLELPVGVPPFHRSGLFTALIAVLTLVFFAAAGFQTHKVLLQRREIQEYRDMAVRELEDARNIQMDLLPDFAPELEGFEIFGRCEPASEVGGDFYDFISLDGRSQVGVAVADVSGKQMQGAMNAVMANGILHLATTETEDTSPSSIVEKANAILTARMKQDTNITMIFGFLNSENRSFNFVNAGHHAHPILVRNGTVSRVEQSGFPLGMKYPMRYKSHQFQFEPGDLLLLMSDGIIEPTDENGVMYAETGKLETSLSNIPPNTPLSGILDMLIQDVKRHAINSIEPQDDITLIGIRATG